MHRHFVMVADKVFDLGAYVSFTIQTEILFCGELCVSVSLSLRWVIRWIVFG